MTSFVPRKPYSREELQQLYPKVLYLQFVQILLRHGERSPVSSRFRNAGLPAYWPYCNAAKRMSSAIMTRKDASTWDELHWRRRLETFGDQDQPVFASGPNGEIDNVCQLGELTDKGRETTLALGQRLRQLYVEQLGFMPRLLENADMIYFRATPMPRALESVQQAFWGMYPPASRIAKFPPPTIITRTPADETLYPNDSNCRRFSQLSRAFAQRTADKWNKTIEMDYLTNLIGKWMPDGQPVAVDSHPRLSGIMDTINSTLAHGPETRLPSEFYDEKGRELIEKIGVEEWFSGYNESQEYRIVGVGGLMGDICSRMVANVEGSGKKRIEEYDSDQTKIKFGISGCHDTTLAAVLSSLGAFGGEKWPPYTSHIAVELFKEEASPGKISTPNSIEREPTLWESLLGASVSKVSETTLVTEGKSRKRMAQLSAEEKKKLDGYYVRLRYNDELVVVPGCKVQGNHLEGDESFCTLEAFKRIVDKFTPENWREACWSNLDKGAFPVKVEKAGF